MHYLHVQVKHGPNWTDVDIFGYILYTHLHLLNHGRKLPHWSVELEDLAESAPHTAPRISSLGSYILVPRLLIRNLFD